MSSQIELYPKKEDLIDSRPFEIGEIYYIKDALVTIPDADRIETKRNIHEGRMVMIVQNNQENFNHLCPIVSIAPLSHDIRYKRANDLVVGKIDVTNRNGRLKYDSLIRLRLIQPVCKVDLERCVCQLKDTKIEELLAMQLEMLGID